MRRRTVTLVLLLSAILLAVAQATSHAGENDDPDDDDEEGTELVLDQSDLPPTRRLPNDLLGGIAPGRTVTAEGVPSMGPEETQLWASALGAQLLEFDPERAVLSGDGASLRDLLARGVVSRLELVLPPQPSVVSEGVGLMGVPAWHAAGHTGAGVRVAIVDVGFLGYEALLGVELPPAVTVKSFQWDGDIHAGSDHGTAVAEIVYDVAPEAQLTLVNFPTSRLAEVVDYLIAQEVDVVNTSLGWWIGPFDGSSSIAQEVQRAVDAGIVWVTSAGNQAERHWGGMLQDVDGDGWADLEWPVEANGFVVGPGDLFDTTVSWVDPTADLDICLYDASAPSLVLLECSDVDQQPGDRPGESVLWVNSSPFERDYAFAVRQREGPATRFDAFVSAEAYDLLYSVPETSLTVPADADGAISVGAVPAFNTTIIESYSGQGPTVDGRLKPDLVAPAQVSTVSYGTGFPGPFSGTSASSPHVAGLAALYLESRPLTRPAAVKTALAGLADPRPSTTTGKNSVFGWGFAQAGALPVDTSAPVWNEGSVLAASAITPTSVTLNWTPASDEEGVAAYRIYRDGALVAQVWSDVLSYSVANLDPLTPYSFTVAAADPAGNWSTGGPAASITTLRSPHGVGLVDPAQGQWHLRDSSGIVTSFFFGNPGDYPISGDWDCDGIDTPGMYRQSDGYVYLRNSNTAGIADIRFFFGNPGDIPLAGDFNGNGCDTVSVYRPAEGRVFVIDELGQNEGGLGAAELHYYFGDPGDKPFVGDFDGDGLDTIGLHRESTGFVYFRQTHTQGVADSQFFFGDPGDRLVAGDWGIVDGIDTPAIFRPSTTTVYFRHTNTQGAADSQLTWGSGGWLPVAGKFG